MRPAIPILVLALPILAGCNGGKAERAAQAEKIELAACRQTYPLGESAFGALVHCELGAARNYVQEVNAYETDAQEKLTADLQKQADAVDQGRITRQDWQSLARQRILKIEDAKATRAAANAIL